MRLLRTEESHQGKFEMEDVTDGEIPPYAILSHRWGDEEVTFEDMKGARATIKKGYQKVKKCCELARRRGFKYVWMDTCCTLDPPLMTMPYEKGGICRRNRWESSPGS
jgi:hypothetical protein